MRQFISANRRQCRPWVTACSACEGVGYRHGFGGSRLCTACDGRGTIPGLDDPRVQAVLRSIEERCPGAVAPGVIVPVAPAVTPTTRNEE